MLCVCCDHFTLWSLASSLFTRAEESLLCRSCSRWLRWRFSAWWPLVHLETAVALLQWLFRSGACTRTNDHVFSIMRSLQCNQCNDSMRQINPNGFQSLCYSMYDYGWVAINTFELSWVERVWNTKKFSVIHVWQHDYITYMYRERQRKRIGKHYILSPSSDISRNLNKDSGK